MAGRVRRYFRKNKDSMKQTGIQAAGGLAVGLLDKQVLSSESGKKMFGGNSYIKPLVVLVGAHFLKSKAPNLASGAAGAAGLLLAQSYYESNETTEGIMEAGATHYPPALGMGGMRGMYDETGAIFERA